MSTGPEGSRRPRFAKAFSGRFTRTQVGLAAAAGVAVLIGGILASGPRPTPPTTGSPNPTSIAVQPSPTESWSALQLADLPTLADLAVSDANTAGIAVDASFTLTTHTQTSAVQLARSLTSTPAIKLSVKAGPTPGTATLTPTVPLTASTRYRFRLTNPDGSSAGSWAFRTAGPLHIVGRLPDAESNDVPVDTGIEVTFDRVGTTDIERHFKIEPAVAGRFEAHGATWAFVPTAPLKAATVYQVTVTAGVSLPGSDSTLERAVSWSFETQASGGDDQPSVAFDRTMFDIEPGTRPIVGLAGYFNESESVPASLPVQVYRLSGTTAAIAAVRALESNEWAVRSDYGLVDTKGLTRVLDTTARFQSVQSGSGVIELPAALQAGWYLADIPRKGRDAQAVLQVTRLAVYAVTSTTRTIAWINDISTQAPVADASIALANGTELGRTSADGLLNVATPIALRVRSADPYGAPDPQFLTVHASDNRVSIVDLGARPGDRYPAEDRDTAVTDPWWDFLSTDRATYRPTDTIHAWGMVRARSNRLAPDQVVLDVVVANDDAAAPFVRRTVATRATGMFIGDLPLSGLPFGDYEVRVRVGGQVVTTAWFSVDDIRKPAYEVSVTASRHALIDGDKLDVTAAARFFDGSLVPGLELNVGPIGESGEMDADRQLTLKTNATGIAAGQVTAANPSDDGPTSMEIAAQPANPEEGEIAGSTSVLVYPSSVWLAGTATIAGGKLVVNGRLANVDLAKAERIFAAGQWPDDPSGKPVVGGSVHVSIVRLVTVRTQVGTDYDYVEKKVVPVYETDIRRETLATRTLTSSSTGAFSTSLVVPSVEDLYEVDLSANDRAGRRIAREVYGERPRSFEPYGRTLWLTGPDQVHVGQAAALTLQRTTGTAPTGDYLFLVAHQGIEDAVLQADPTFERTLGDPDLPNLTVRAIAFSSIGYEVAGDVSIAPILADRTIKVVLTPDQAHYQPGDTAHVSIRTTVQGQPVAADVVVRAVDEKLYAIGGAADPYTIGTLMSAVAPGFLQSYTSQFVPGRSYLGDGYGDEGGEGRGDFRDTATFQLVRTDSDGRATASFTMPDNLTGWHVSTTAVDSRLDAGDASIILPVGLPFFVEATLAPEYLVGERPVLTLRAFGDSLPAGAPVRFSVSGPSLGLAGVTLDGTAFTTVRVPLPVLTAGDHRITIAGNRLLGAGSDKLTRTIHVISSRVSALVGSFEALTPGYQPPTSAGFASYVVTDAGRGALLSVLRGLASSDSARFERAAAAAIARDLLVSEFDVDPSLLPPVDFDRSRYQRGEGVAILPYASPSVDLAVRAAILSPSLVDGNQLRATFRNALNPDPDAPSIGTDADPVEILAGQAAVGEDVLADLQRLRSSSLDLLQQAWLALAFLASGDEVTTRELEREILRAHGQAFGPVVRVDDGPRTHATTALLLVVAAGLGDPLAASMSRYLEAYATPDEQFALEQLGYVRSMLDRMPRVSGRFAWTVDGERHDVTLQPGGAFSIVLTPAQQAGFVLDPVEGDLTVTSLSHGPLSAAAFDSPSPVHLTRVVSPSMDAPADQIVSVTIQVTFDADAPSGCFRVTDTAPSGLVPLSEMAFWPDTIADPLVTTRPYDVTGQRVSWCVDKTTRMPLVYAARVVSPGTYTWEPAVVQLETAPATGAMTGSLTYTIR